MIFELMLVLQTSAFSQAQANKTVQDVIPITMANLRGHKNLYSEGWFLVTSSEKALPYAREEGIENAKSALVRFQNDVKQRGIDKSKQIEKFEEEARARGKKSKIKNQKRAEDLQEETKALNQDLNNKSSQNARQSWEKFVRGNISFVERTESERKELINIPGNFFSKLKSDFSNLNDIMWDLTSENSPRLKNIWSTGFKEAAREFDEEYKASGEKTNSFLALGNIISGYFKSLYYGLMAPGGQSVSYGIITSADYIAKSAVYVGAGGLSVAGRTVESVGMSLYYSTAVGYKLLSPTVESALLLSLASVQKIAAPLTSLGGSGLGVLNQVSVSVVDPTMTTAGEVAHSTFQNARYAGLVTYDLIKATGQVAISEVKTGIVLGYNAISAIPTHLVLGTVNSVFFLAWDGPRLVIAKATGELGSIPVGTVVDMEELKKDNSIRVEVIESNTEDIQKVLEELPRDL